ncbi:hypothetical protein [Kribbia dieselivorans]|uniref:hypothetical protein n=1 Tax=Kribbia dieselivorans TaxID=331526 RepID=UPI000838F815|nr:hypothetical protein [Kribbia dieselivorans]
MGIALLSTVTGVLALSSQALADRGGDQDETTVAEVIDRAVAAGVGPEKLPDVAVRLTISPDGVPEGDIDGVSIADVQDAALLAKQDGISGRTILERQRQHERIMKVAEVAQKHESTFAGYDIDGPTGWIGFVGEVPADVRTRLEATYGELPSRCSSSEYAVAYADVRIR